MPPDFHDYPSQAVYCWLSSKVSLKIESKQSSLRTTSTCRSRLMTAVPVRTRQQRALSLSKQTFSMTQVVKPRTTVPATSPFWKVLWLPQTPQNVHWTAGPRRLNDLDKAVDENPVSYDGMIDIILSAAPFPMVNKRRGVGSTSANSKAGLRSRLR